MEERRDEERRGETDRPERQRKSKRERARDEDRVRKTVFCFLVILPRLAAFL